jgi:hypothetical protein
MDALTAEHESAAGRGRMEALGLFRGITSAGERL